jgi:hypothetical protein
MSDYAVINPATGETLTTYSTIGDQELHASIGNADAAHRALASSTTAQTRAALLRRVGELHAERRRELGEIIVREMGKPIREAIGEVDFCVAIYVCYADHAAKLLEDEPIELLEGTGSATPSCSSTHRSAPSPQKHSSRSTTTRAYPARVHQHLRDQRPDRDGDRRPAGARRLTDRLRARRSPRSPAAISRRSCSNSVALTHSSC